MIREIGWFLEDRGISPIQLGIGVIVGLGIGGYEVHIASGIIDQNNSVIRQQNGQLDESDFEIRKGNVYGTINRATIDALVRERDSITGEKNDLAKSGLRTNLVDCEIAVDRTSMTFDLDEGKEIIILGRKLKMTRAGFVFTKESGEEMLYPRGLIVGPDEGKREIYNVDYALITRTASLNPNRFTVTVTGSCAPQATPNTP